MTATLAPAFSQAFSQAGVAALTISAAADFSQPAPLTLLTSAAADFSHCSEGTPTISALAADFSQPEPRTVLARASAEFSQKPFLAVTATLAPAFSQAGVVDTFTGSVPDGPAAYDARSRRSPRSLARAETSSATFASLLASSTSPEHVFESVCSASTAAASESRTNPSVMRMREPTGQLCAVVCRDAASSACCVGVSFACWRWPLSSSPVAGTLAPAPSSNEPGSDILPPPRGSPGRARRPEQITKSNASIDSSNRTPRPSPVHTGTTTASHGFHQSSACSDPATPRDLRYDTRTLWGRVSFPGSGYPAAPGASRVSERFPGKKGAADMEEPAALPRGSLPGTPGASPDA